MIILCKFFMFFKIVVVNFFSKGFYIMEGLSVRIGVIKIFVIVFIIELMLKVMVIMWLVEMLFIFDVLMFC